MLSAVPNRRRALAAQTGEFSCSGARDDRMGLLRHASLMSLGSTTKTIQPRTSQLHNPLKYNDLAMPFAKTGED